jgi:hypothetical protein
MERVAVSQKMRLGQSCFLFPNNQAGYGNDYRLHKQGTLMDWAERSYRFSFVVLSIFNALGVVWMVLSL